MVHLVVYQGCKSGRLSEFVFTRGCEKRTRKPSALAGYSISKLYWLGLCDGFFGELDRLWERVFVKKDSRVLCYLPGGSDSRGERTGLQEVKKKKKKKKKQQQQGDNKFCEKFALFKTKWVLVGKLFVPCPFRLNSHHATQLSRIVLLQIITF